MTGAVAGGSIAGFGIAALLMLGVKKPEWKADPATLGMHVPSHLAFGLALAEAATEL